MQVHKFTGLIIGSTPHAEFDRIISLFSHEAGRVRIMAKGVRRIKSHRSFHLDVLASVQMEIEEPSRSLQPMRYLREVSTLHPFASLKAAPERFAAGCLIAVFLNRILPEATPQRDVLLLTEETLHALNAGSEVKNTLLVYFLKVTRLMGFLPKTVRKDSMRETLWDVLSDLDPQFMVHARRTLGIFSSISSTESS